MKGGGYLTVGDGTRIFFSSEGPDDGIPVLLLHGWVCDHNDYAFQIPLLLSLGFRVIGMDYRGHGHSSVTDATTKFDPLTLTADAVALLAHLGVQRDNKAIVMGHSLGGLVARELALQHGHLVRGVVMVDAAHSLTPAAMAMIISLVEGAESGYEGVAATDFFAMAGLYPADKTPAWLLPFHQRRAWAMQGRVVANTFKQMRDYLGESGAVYLKRTQQQSPGGEKIPQLITTAAEASLEMEREGGFDEKWDRLELIPAGHFHHIVDPESFNRVLKSWLVERKWAKET